MRSSSISSRVFLSGKMKLFSPEIISSDRTFFARHPYETTQTLQTDTGGRTMSSSLRHLRRPQQASSLKRPPQQRVCLSSTSAATNNKQQVRAKQSANFHPEVGYLSDCVSSVIIMSLARRPNFKTPKYGKNMATWTCTALPHVHYLAARNSATRSIARPVFCSL